MEYLQEYNKINKKISYEEVYDIIYNDREHELRVSLDLLYDLSKKLQYKRLILPEKVMNNSNNNFDLCYSDFSHKMIEEMMILNNILVAKTLSDEYEVTVMEIEYEVDDEKVIHQIVTNIKG